MRIIKEPEERRSEILDAAERLFFTKGYARATVQDILDEIGIAKGTFYYYYKSKEEVMDAIIKRELDQRVARARQIIADTGIQTVDKFFLIMLDPDREKERNEGLVEQFHQPGNAQLHQKSMTQLIERMAPVLSELVSQGVEEKIFDTEYPLESTQILLASASVLFDEGLFTRSDEEEMRMAKAYLYAMEQILGARKGCFDRILQLITG